MSLSRSRSDFSDGERRLLEMMRPVLAGTFERLHDLNLFSSVAANHRGKRIAVLVDERNVVGWATAAAMELLGIRLGDRLPGELREWRERVHQPPRYGPSTSMLSIDGRPMRITLIPDAYLELDGIELAPLWSSEIGALRSLGLTRRQAEVFLIALEGHKTEEIASRLNLSQRTVEKHFEAIYGRLGVHTRNQAILVLRDRLGT